MNDDMHMTQAEADAYMENVKQNVAKILSVSKADILKVEAAAKKNGQSENAEMYKRIPLRGKKRIGVSSRWGRPL